MDGKKFDLRQWALIDRTGVYLYSECYVRFSVVRFSLENTDDRYIHLTNTSVQRTHKDFEESGIPENMWDDSQLQRFLR